MRKRHVYYLDLESYRPIDPGEALRFETARRPTDSDIKELAELMVDAYRDTIDYDGETVEEALAEVKSYFMCRDGRPILDCSHLIFNANTLVSACLVSWWRERQLPLIAYLMTRPEWKNQGLGAAVLGATLQDLRDQGHRQVGAVITEGNTPSEILHRRHGFLRRDG